MTRNNIAQLILTSLKENETSIKEMYEQSKSTIGYFFIDDLLPQNLVEEIYNSFPKPHEMVLKNSLREQKYISAQMNMHHPILEEMIYAFQNKEVVNFISEVCGVSNVFPDKYLYAGGISMMGDNHFLNPHLDNSHDKDRDNWRVFNLLFYVTPNWKLENGGHLELWPNGLKQNPIVIESKFNRLVLMATHNDSLHSVSKIKSNDVRCCVSNYYFSNKPLKESDTFHVTSFRGRPQSFLTDKLLLTDTFLRMCIRKFYKKGIKENPHYYKK